MDERPCDEYSRCTSKLLNEQAVERRSRGGKSVKSFECGILSWGTVRPLGGEAGLAAPRHGREARSLAD